VRAARLGENIRFPIRFHMQSPEIQTKNSNLAQTGDQSINQAQIMQSKSSKWFLYEIQKNQLVPLIFLLILSLMKSTSTSKGGNLNST